MPGGHDTEKFKLVGCWVDKVFLAQIDEARAGKPRSLFVREALAEKLLGQGVVALREHIDAPDRAGKGGRKPSTGPVTYRKSRPGNLVKIATVNSLPDDPASKLLGKVSSSTSPGAPK